jgi:hypothetical protein
MASARGTGRAAETKDRWADRMIIEFSTESRRALFRARVIADEARHKEVRSEAILAGLFVSADALDACSSLQVNVASLVADLGLTTSLDNLRAAEKSLALANLAFGSREHGEIVGKTTPHMPLSAEALKIIRSFEVEDDKQPRSVTIGDLLFAFLTDVPRFASVSAAHNLPLHELAALMREGS